MKTIIHVNQHKIKSNRKTKELAPVLSIKTYKENKYCHEALILDEKGNIVAKVIYKPEKPLNCGAQCWIETDLTVKPILHECPNIRRY